MDLQARVNLIKEKFAKLKSGERRLILALAAALALTFYFRLFIKPAMGRIAVLKKQTQDNKDRARLYQSQFPDLDKERKGLLKIRQSIAQMKEDIRGIQSRLINAAQVPQLLMALIKSAQGLQIDFQSVKQKIEADRGGLSRLYIDLKFDAGYEDTVNYIRKVEGISDFLKLEEIDVSPSKKSPRSLITVSSTLSSILADNPAREGELPLKAAKVQEPKVTIKHNPLMPRLNLGQEKKKDLRVSGITFRSTAGASSAIINDTVLREGDEIDGATIERISPDSITVKDGPETYEVKVER
ncbi:MAG: hypothetical protein A3G38_00800 [Omnitrophica WOR_2 bacterium RIFCSPLOWO2_12_FULL_51_8]|nr:MAG: hypothetical protein A3G38_00800 [Omnitrophica WOR_2 bacterium RIFCSPLOWO2_12_FULL_51_8]